MLSTVVPISSLLLGMGVLLAGSGLLGTLLGLRGDLAGFNGFTLGLVMSGFYIGYIAGAFICPPLIRRVGHIRTFTAMAALNAAVCIAYGMEVNPVLWWVLRVINGITMVTIYMVLESWLNEQMHAKRDKIFAAYMMTSYLALGLGQFLIAIYGVENLGSFALAGVFYCIGLIPIALTRVQQPTPVTRPPLSLRRLYRISPAGCVSGMMSGVLAGTFWALAPAFAATQGLSAVEVAVFTATAIFAGAIMQWPVGHAAAHRDRRSVLAVTCTLTALSATAMFVAGPLSKSALIGTVALFGGFVFTIYSLAVTHTHDRVDSAESLEATKVLLLLHGAGAAIGPVLTGAVMSQLGSATLPITMAVMAVFTASFVAWRIRVKNAVPDAQLSTFMAVNRTSSMAMDMDPRTPDTSHDAEPVPFEPVHDAEDELAYHMHPAAEGPADDEAVAALVAAAEAGFDPGEDLPFPAPDDTVKTIDAQADGPSTERPETPADHPAENSDDSVDENPEDKPPGAAA